MRIQEVFAKITGLEEYNVATHLTWSSIHVWPLIRYCVWVEITSEDAVTTLAGQRSTSPSLISKIHDKFIGLAPAFERLKALVGILQLSLADIRISRASEANLMFISRPVYLQKLPGGKYFDRIIDPLISVLDQNLKFEKLYITLPKTYRSLHFPAQVITARKVRALEIPEAHRVKLDEIAQYISVDAVKFRNRYSQALRQFSAWFHFGEQIFEQRPDLKKIYVTSWYFPDMMGLIAAARKRGIHVIDVQHGKQGRFQGMYSGWTKIPSGSYLMMPDSFWCWGMPSCKHILASSRKRQSHIPFIGGFPWIDYYRRNICVTAQTKKKNLTTKKRRCVLVTTQPLIPINPEPIPDFIVQYLRSATSDDYFIFRSHPNDAQFSDYIKKRLVGVSVDKYEIDRSGNLYDQFIVSTHHITAFSSCCYEAVAFETPTLLFGEAASEIYADEIALGVFSWTRGNVNELKKWLEADTYRLKKATAKEVYIQSSLSLTQKLVNQID